MTNNSPVGAHSTELSQTRHSVCALDCPDTCALVLQVGANGRATKIGGDPAHPITRGFLCGKVARLLYQPHLSTLEELWLLVPVTTCTLFQCPPPTLDTHQLGSSLHRSLGTTLPGTLISALGVSLPLSASTLCCVSFSKASIFFQRLHTY